LASTKRLTASPVSPDWPSPVARVRLTPLTVNEAVAWPVTMPALGEVKVTEKWPLPSVVPDRVLPPRRVRGVPLLLLRLTVTLAPEAADETPLMTLLTVTMKVWGSPTALTSSGAMLMLASTTLTVATLEGAGIP